jgi:hypothetical protein
MPQSKKRNCDRRHKARLKTQRKGGELAGGRPRLHSQQPNQVCRAGGLFNPGRTLESRVDLLRPVQEVEFVAPDTRWGGLEYRFTPHIGIFGEIAYVFSNLSNNNFIQTKFGLRFAFQAKN